jgi:hypothetical protein
MDKRDEELSIGCAILILGVLIIATTVITMFVVKAWAKDTQTKIEQKCK